MQKSTQKSKDSLMTLHDEIAEFTAQYDADKEISAEIL